MDQSLFAQIVLLKPKSWTRDNRKQKISFSAKIQETMTGPLCFLSQKAEIVSAEAALSQALDQRRFPAAWVCLLREGRRNRRNPGFGPHGNHQLRGPDGNHQLRMVSWFTNQYSNRISLNWCLAKGLGPSVCLLLCKFSWNAKGPRF